MNIESFGFLSFFGLLQVWLELHVAGISENRKQ